MFLMIDNYDSFVYNLVRYFQELGEEVLVYRNDKITIEEIEALHPTGIILSPGPKAPKDSNICLDIIDKFKGKIPILGICLGYQCIGHYFGGNIKRGVFPMHGKISQVEHSNEGIFRGIKNPLRVTRYHSLIVEEETLPKELIITSKSDDGVIMGIAHRNYKIFGVQFHPEAELTEQGHEILNNFITIAKED
jgi:anthranilate synthase/aminodeoxychorismate synthase-like glutamine amidotransferase